MNEPRRLARWTVALLWLLAATPLAAESPVVLTVRLYSAASTSPQALLAARLVAAPILHDAGLNVVFRACGRVRSSEAPADPCDEPLGPRELVVRAVDAPAVSATLSSYTFGVAYVVKATNRGWLATLYADRIAEAAGRVHIEPSVLLGRVLAHEVGHLLLGTSYHGDTGLMRAEWSDALLHQGDGAEWRFSMLESAAIQRTLLSE